MPLQHFGGQLLWDGTSLYNECCCSLPEICTDCLLFDDGEGGEYGWLQDQFKWSPGIDDPPNDPIPCGFTLYQTYDECIKVVKKPFVGEPPVFQGYKDIVVGGDTYEWCDNAYFTCGAVTFCYQVAYFKFTDAFDTVWVVSVLLSGAVSGYLGFGCDITHGPYEDCYGVCCDCDTKETCEECLSEFCTEHTTCGWVYTAYEWKWEYCELDQAPNADFCVDRSNGWEADIGLFEYCGSTYIDPFDESSSSSDSSGEGDSQHQYEVRWFKYEVPGELTTYIISLIDNPDLCNQDVGLPPTDCIVPECSSSSSSSESSSSSSSSESSSSSSSEDDDWIIDGADLVFDGANQVVI